MCKHLVILNTQIAISEPLSFRHVKESYQMIFILKFLYYFFILNFILFIFHLVK